LQLLSDREKSGHAPSQLALNIDDDLSAMINVSCTISPSDYSDPSKIRVGDPIGELEKEFKESFDDNMRQFLRILQGEWDPDSKDPHMGMLQDQHREISMMVEFAKENIDKARKNIQEFEMFYLEDTNQCQCMLETMGQFMSSLRKAKDRHNLLFEPEKKKKYRN